MALHSSFAGQQLCLLIGAGACVSLPDWIGAGCLDIVVSALQQPVPLESIYLVIARLNPSFHAHSHCVMNSGTEFIF